MHEIFRKDFFPFRKPAFPFIFKNQESEKSPFSLRQVKGKGENRKTSLFFGKKLAFLIFYSPFIKATPFFTFYSFFEYVSFSP